MTHEHIVRPLRTLNAVYDAATRASLNPEWTTTRKEVLFACPQCKYDGAPHQASATILAPANALVARCNGCNDEADILYTLAELAPTWNVHELHPERNGDGPNDPTLLAWTPLDLVTIGDTPRIPPAIGGLIYPGRRHLFWGESESGKSWLALGCAADELKAGNGVIWADLDYMGAQDILERLRQLGVSDDTTRQGFTFYQPDGPLEGHSLDAVLQLLTDTRARLVIIDAFTGLCALHNLNPEKTIDIESAFKKIQPLCTAGAAVTILDHVVKNADARGRYALGAERKLSGADVAIGFTLIEHYGRGHTGRARLIVHKDRPAQLQRPVAGIFTLRSHPDTHQITWSIEQDASKGEDGAFRPTGYMERVSVYLEKFTSPMSRADVLEHVTGKAEHLRTAMDALITEGYLLAEDGPRNSQMLTVLTAFREDDE